MMAFLRLPITATRAQVASYFLCVCLFSISFLVFLNSAVSFVITQRIGQKKHVGDAVGTLGFADELVALVACPLWGVLSDRVGVKTVAVCGYTIVGFALILFVQAKNVYPQLLLGRMFFAIGGAATSTMVTAILPTMMHIPESRSQRSRHGRLVNGSGGNFTPSISSELTITPARSHSASQEEEQPDTHSASSQLAGYVGLFTGLGALLAVVVFLPLPARFQAGGSEPADAVAYSFYIVGAVALLVACVCLFGLRNLPGEQDKGVLIAFGLSGAPKDVDDRHAEPKVLLTYPKLLLRAVALGFRDINVGLAYVGGFVARASSVAISLFIPLYVNAYFIASGRCPENPDDGFHDPSIIKRECRRAYIVASILTGVSQLIALLCAPLMGYLSGQYTNSNLPLLVAAAAGTYGYIAFGMLKSPDPSSPDGSIGVYFIVTLLGISQIGAIVCSLGLLARGVQTEDEMEVPHASNRTIEPDDSDATPLLNPVEQPPKQMVSRSHLKGSIAGIYSLAGGAGILLLTKVGGILFDRVDNGVPFFIMAGFNAVLLLVGTAGAVLNLRGEVQGGEQVHSSDVNSSRDND